MEQAALVTFSQAVQAELVQVHLLVQVVAVVDLLVQVQQPLQQMVAMVETAAVAVVLQQLAEHQVLAATA